MAVMEFLRQNYFDTTTMVTVDSNTGLADYLIDKNKKTQYQTSGYTTNTSSTIIVSLSETSTISHILLQNHNLKSFSIYYDTITTTSLLQSYSTNSETSTYLSFSTISSDKILLVMSQAMTADTEKKIGQFIITERKLIFSDNPSYANYKPLIDKTQIKHVMPDGGISLFNIRDKYKAKITLKYISSSFYDSLFNLYEDGNPLYFLPFPTSSSWDGNAYEIVWSGKFDFTFSDNAKTTYSGNINIEETVST